MNLSLRYALAALVTAICTVAVTQSQAAQQVRITITNNGPDGGVAITPVWFGFHDGSFDSYDGGQTAQPGLEAISEDGNPDPISADFLAGRSYVQGGVSGVFDDAQMTMRIDGTLGSTEITAAPPITPGESASTVIDIDTDGSNRYFSYVSMVIPSNDFFVANGNPLAHDLMELYDGEGSISFNIGLPGTVNDAGTEAEDYNNSAANGLFGLAGGQGPPDTPAGSLGLNIANVVGDNPLSALNFPGGAPAAFNFNDEGLYPNGIATITITAVPEPTSVALAGLSLVATCFFRRRR